MSESGGEHSKITQEKSSGEELFPEAEVRHGYRTSDLDHRPFTYYAQSTADGSSQGWSKLLQQDTGMLSAFINKDKKLVWATDNSVIHDDLAEAEGCNMSDDDVANVIIDPSDKAEHALIITVRNPEEGAEGGIAAVDYFARSLGERAKDVNIWYTVAKWHEDIEDFEEKEYLGPLTEFKNPWPVSQGE